MTQEEQAFHLYSVNFYQELSKNQVTLVSFSFPVKTPWKWYNQARTRDILNYLRQRISTVVKIAHVKNESFRPLPGSEIEKYRQTPLEQILEINHDEIREFVNGA